MEQQGILLKNAYAGVLAARFVSEKKHRRWLVQGVPENSLLRHGEGQILGMFRLRAPTRLRFRPRRGAPLNMTQGEGNETDGQS
jgi:hypothetical protein